MKPKEFTRIKNALLPHLPGFVADRKKLFITPVDDFLLGVHFQSSFYDSNSFYLWVFVLPLFVPHDSFGVTHGKRLRNRSPSEVWRDDDANAIMDLLDTIQSEAMPFLDRLSSLEGFVNYHIERDIRRANSHELEAFAYTLIKSGDYSYALESVGELKRRLEGSTVPWVVEQRGRAQLMEEKLLQNPEAALAQLEEWKKWTIGKLKLEKFR